MFKQLSDKFCHIGCNWKYNLSKFALAFSFIIFYFYVGETFALQESDKVAEIATLTNDVTKLAKNGCYITGCASALIGSVWAVAQQSLKVFGVAAAVTLLSFKAPSFFTSSMLI
jgi:hypothetical protein